MEEKTDARDYSAYDGMSTEDLEEIVRGDLLRPDSQETDTELLWHILGVLVERDPSFAEWDAEKSWEAFKKEYLPRAERQRDAAEKIRKREREKSGPAWKRWVQAAAAVLLILVIGGSVSAYAKEYDLWERIAVWANGVFRLEFAHRGTAVSLEGTEPESWWKEEQETDAEGNKIPKVYPDLQSALDEAGITEKLVPTWIPEGYVPVKADVIDAGAQKIFEAYYEKEGEILLISISAWREQQVRYVEIDEKGGVSEYIQNEIVHYVLKNGKERKAIWSVSNFEGLIKGMISEQELKKMIDSIYLTESVQAKK